MKPKVSYIIIFYNQRRWVKEAIKSAYEQTSDEIEFIFSDDASTDGTFDEIKNAINEYDHALRLRTILLSSDLNLGIVAHCAKVLTVASGEIISLNAGDDLSAPTRIAKASLCFADKDVAMVFSNQFRINENGKIVDVSCYSEHRIKSFEQMINDESPGISGAGVIWRKEVFSKFGPLPTSVANEDDQLIVRARLLGKTILLKEYLFYYRVHGKSASSWLRSFYGTDEQIVREGILEHYNRIQHIIAWKALIIAHYEKDKASLLLNLDTKINSHERKAQLLLTKSKLKRIKLCKNNEEVILALFPALLLRTYRVFRHVRYILGRVYRSRLRNSQFKYVGSSR